MRYLGIKTLLFLLFGFLFFFAPHPTLAVSVSISQYPSSITQAPFTLTASISGATSGTNYVRIDLYKEGSTNYFGETFNSTDWYSGSDYHQYLAVPIVNGQWSGTIQGSLGGPSTSEYDGTGTYRIRIRRYTAGGTTNATEADNSSVVVQIVMPSPTPTPTNTPAPTMTPVPTNTPKPTATLTPAGQSPLGGASPTQKPTTSQILALATSSAEASGEGDLFVDDDIPVSPTPVKKVAAAHTSILPSIFFGIGGVIVIGCGILFVYKYKKNDEDNTNE